MSCFEVCLAIFGALVLSIPTGVFLFTCVFAESELGKCYLQFRREQKRLKLNYYLGFDVQQLVEAEHAQNYRLDKLEKALTNLQTTRKRK